MPLYDLHLKVTLTNIRRLEAAANFAFAAHFKCARCGEVPEKLRYFDWEVAEMEGVLGEVNVALKCKECQSLGTAKIETERSSANIESQAEADEEDVVSRAIATLDCRGIEPISWSTGEDWVVYSTSNAMFEKVDITNDWTEYDEESGQAMSIADVEFSIGKGSKK